MKHFFILSISLLFFTTSFAQFQINYDQIGDFKIGASVQEIEKLCGTKFTMPLDDFEVKFNVTSKGIPFQIVFREIEVDKVKSMVLNSVSIKDKRFKTKEGAYVGMTKNELIDLYKDFLSFQMLRYFDNETFDFPVNKLDFQIDENNNRPTIDYENMSERRIIFHIEDNIVNEIQIINSLF
jgi:hypothetical protein